MKIDCITEAGHMIETEIIIGTTISSEVGAILKTIGVK